MQMSGTGGDNDMIMIQSTNAYTRAVPVRHDRGRPDCQPRAHRHIPRQQRQRDKVVLLRGQPQPEQLRRPVRSPARATASSRPTAPSRTGRVSRSSRRTRPATASSTTSRCRSMRPATTRFRSNGGTPVSVGNIGTGPFYVVLGERAGEPSRGNPEQTAWYSASLTPPGGSGDFAVDDVVKRERVESVPASALPTTSVDGSSGSGSGDAASSRSLDPAAFDRARRLAAAARSRCIRSRSLDRGARLGRQRRRRRPGGAVEHLALGPVGRLPRRLRGSAQPARAGPGVLAGSAYAGVPLESVTLADVLTSDPTLRTPTSRPSTSGTSTCRRAR